MSVPWPAHFNALAYVLAGSGTVGAERRPIRTGQLATFGFGESLTFAADAAIEGPSPTFDILLLGGEPIREPVAAYGPFVMNTKAELAAGVRGLPEGAARLDPGSGRRSRRRSHRSPGAPR